VKPHAWVLYDVCLHGLEILRLLLSNTNIDFNISLPQESNNTILHFILHIPRERLQDNKEDVVKLLLRTGTSLLQRDRLGDTPLHLLAGDNTPDGGRLLKILFNDFSKLRELCSTYINSKNNYGNTPLVVAVLYNNIKCVQLLLDYRADPYSPGKYGMTALDFTGQMEYAEITALLLAHMAKREQEQQEAANNGASGDERLLKQTSPSL
jgi:ankyrin repeat protein